MDLILGIRRFVVRMSVATFNINFSYQFEFSGMEVVDRLLNNRYHPQNFGTPGSRILLVVDDALPYDDEFPTARLQDRGFRVGTSISHDAPRRNVDAGPALQLAHAYLAVQNGK